MQGQNVELGDHGHHRPGVTALGHVVSTHHSLLKSMDSCLGACRNQDHPHLQLQLVLLPCWRLLTLGGLTCLPQICFLLYCTPDLYSSIKPRSDRDLSLVSSLESLTKGNLGSSGPRTRSP